MKTKLDQKINQNISDNHTSLKDHCFSRDYVDFLNDAGWVLERRRPSNRNNYSDLLEDTEWEYCSKKFEGLKHYRRDLDAFG